MSSKRYEQLAADLGKAVDDGVLKPGERLPSVRQASLARRLSITTVKRAYLLLESQGAIEVRARSGYFVTSRPATRPDTRLATSRPDTQPATVDVARAALAVLKAIQTRGALPLGSPYPDPTLFPWRRIQQHSSEISKRFKSWNVVDDIPPGNAEMIRQITRRHFQCGLTVDPAEVVVTAGATEAINLCLQAVAKTGDTVAVESPTFYGMLQAIERLGMRAIELPTCPHTGIDLDALANLLQRQKIDACLTMPNFQNPLGFSMPDDRKQALVALARQYDMPLIENGVFNELHHGPTPPTTLKQHDTDGRVLHCGSFSKSLTAGVRIGWAVAGRYHEQVEKLKFLTTLATSAVSQLAISAYLTRDGWDHHLRAVRQTMRQRVQVMRGVVLKHFPPGTRVSHPDGGYLLWIELAPSVDGLRLHGEALERGITISPGRVFANSDLYRHFIRINASYEVTTEIEAALSTLAAMVRHQSSSAADARSA